MFRHETTTSLVNIQSDSSFNLQILPSASNDPDTISASINTLQSLLDSLTKNARVISNYLLNFLEVPEPARSHIRSWNQQQISMQTISPRAVKDSGSSDRQLSNNTVKESIATGDLHKGYEDYETDDNEEDDSDGEFESLADQEGGNDK